MSWKVVSFLFVPLILAGCTAFHYMYQSNQEKDRFNSKGMPAGREELDEYFKELNGFKR